MWNQTRPLMTTSVPVLFAEDPQARGRSFPAGCRKVNVRGPGPPSCPKPLSMTTQHAPLRNLSEKEPSYLRTMQNQPAPTIQHQTLQARRKRARKLKDRCRHADRDMVDFAEIHHGPNDDYVVIIGPMSAMWRAILSSNTPWPGDE